MELTPVLLSFFALVISGHATETTTPSASRQDHDIQLQTHLNQVPDVDAVNYYNKNVNRAFRLFRPDLQTDDEKLKEKYGIEFIPTLIAKQLLPTYPVTQPSLSPALAPRVKRDAGAIRFGDSAGGSAAAAASPKYFGGLGSDSGAHAHTESQSLTASLNFGPFGASLTTTNSHGGSHSHAAAHGNGLGGFDGFGGAGSHASANAQSGSFGYGGGPWAPPGYGGSGSHASAHANAGSFGNGVGPSAPPGYGGSGSHASAHASSSAFGLSPPPPHGYYGHYGGYPTHGHGHYGSGYGYGDSYNPHYPSGPGYGYNPYAGGPQYHQHYPHGGLYAGGPAESHYPGAYHGYGRGANTKSSKSNV